MSIKVHQTAKWTRRDDLVFLCQLGRASEGIGLLPVLFRSTSCSAKNYRWICSKLLRDLKPLPAQLHTTSCSALSYFLVSSKLLPALPLPNFLGTPSESRGATLIPYIRRQIKLGIMKDGRNETGTDRQTDIQIDTYLPSLMSSMKASPAFFWMEFCHS